MLSTTAIERVRSVFYGSTLHMRSNWPELQKLERETFLNIIVGDSPLSDFDLFAAKWRSLGGDAITQEVAKVVSIRDEDKQGGE